MSEDATGLDSAALTEQPPAAEPAAPEADALAVLRGALNDSLRTRVAEALSDPLVCWFVLRSPEERALIVQLVNEHYKEHPPG